MLRWSERARVDLKAIHDRIRQNSPGNAEVVVREFLARAEQLPTLPRAGRVVPELSDPDIREVPVHGWRLIYQLRGEHVFVLALIHKRRLPASDELRG